MWRRIGSVGPCRWLGPCGPWSAYSPPDSSHTYTHARVRVGVKCDVGELRVHATHGRRKVTEETNVMRSVMMLMDCDGRAHLAVLATFPTVPCTRLGVPLPRLVLRSVPWHVSAWLNERLRPAAECRRAAHLRPCKRPLGGIGTDRPEMLRVTHVSTLLVYQGRLAVRLRTALRRQHDPSLLRPLLKT